MLIGLLDNIGIFCIHTWIVWPFLFVFSFAFGLAELIKNEKPSFKPLIWAGFSLLIMFCAVLSGPV
ncbi:hypothetical protein CLNEO_28060 [Anaerotignum neopropionicum]|uniref:Uncharacterized protein n=1 Tax=Anaerotignum neopropionicum TaxID=36847 RepID=A0A136WBD8_9FIRM|nr:hypothetical protein CLNEO_28060 [Anaerotignum neopropionicum]